jgi:poly-gamma-glutamate synthesis protein (capsule biosynthesis protein)
VRFPITLVAVGDLQLGDSPTTVGYGFFSRYQGHQIDELFADLQPSLRPADVLFANLETTLAPPPAGASGRDRLQLRGEPEFATALRRVGFTVLNVANNHAVQHGDDTFHQTVAWLRAEGIACCGIQGTDGWISEPVLLGNGALGVLGYCLRPRQYGNAKPPYAEGSPDEICADVRRLKDSGAQVVVSLHWGEEFVPTPSRDEVEIAHRIIDAGATAIIGHHPHVVRPVERYGEGVIAYSLGNFMGDMTWYGPFREGAVLRCTIDATGRSDATVMSTRLRDDYRPIPSGQHLSPVPSHSIQALGQVEYERAIAETWRRQRIAAYRSAVINLRRIPPRVLIQLVVQTLRNKITALVKRGAGD